MNCLAPGLRLTFRNCRLIKKSVYEARTRNGIERTVWRYVLNCPEYGSLVYSGVWLNIQPNESFDIKATVKRFETIGWKMTRIARVKIICENEKKNLDSLPRLI